MTSFSEKIKRKKQEDENLLKTAMEDIYQPLGNQRQNAVDSEMMHNPLSTELKHICKYFSMTMPDCSGSADDEDMIEGVLLQTGIMRRKILLRDHWWKEGAAPLLCTDKDGKYYAMIPAVNGGYQCCMDGRMVNLKAKHAALFEKEAYCFFEPLEAKSLSTKDFLLFLLHSFNKRDVLWLVSISISAVLAGMVMPVIHQMIFRTVIPSGTADEVLGISVLIIGTVLVTAFLILARSLWLLRIGSKIEMRAQNAVWGRILTLPADFFHQYESGDITQRVSAVNDVCDILGGPFISTVLSALFSAMYLIQIMNFTPVLFVPALIIVFLLQLLYLSVAGAAILRQRKNKDIDSKLSGMLYQMIHGVEKIKTTGSENKMFLKWAQLFGTREIMPRLFLLAYEAISAFLVFGGTMWMYYIAGMHHLSASDYIAFNSAFALFYSAVMSISGIITQIAQMKPALELMRPILNTVPESTGVQKKVDELKGEIELNHISFRYQDNMPYVLDDLNLHIHPGEYIGIVGSSGCGKSTLFRVLLGFEQPQKGFIYYDRQDFNCLDKRSVRRRIGTVLQNGKLFSGDLYANIIIGAPWKTVDDAWEAAEKSGFAEDMKKMPMGMYTMVSEGGKGLSGGQRQRLLIARALVASPNILLFDEATSALDNISQAKVIETLDQLNCTRLVIAHRLSTIKGCSRIIYLHKGKIVEDGTFDELIALNGRFAEMAKRQMI